MRRLWFLVHYSIARHPFDYPCLRLLQRSDDADLLRDVDLHLLLGDPLMPMLEYFERCFRVPGQRLFVKCYRQLALPVGQALADGYFDQRVKFTQPAQLGRRHIGSIGKIVTLHAQPRYSVQRLQARLGGLQRAL